MQATDNHDEEVRRAAVRQALGAVGGLLRVGLIAVDPAGRCWFRSQRWEDRSGTAGDAFHGRPWYEGVHPDDREEVAGRWRSLRGRGGRLGTFRTVGVDGVVRRCRAERVPMVSPGGEGNGYLVVVADADAGADADALAAADAGAGAAASTGGEAAGTGGGPGALGEARPDGTTPVLTAPHVLDAVLAGAPDIITILNPDGSWRWSSGAAMRLLGHQAEFDPRDGILRLLHPDDVQAAGDAFAQAVTGELKPDSRTEFRVRAADGSWRLMEVSFDVLLDEPSVHGVVVHTRDVSDRRRALDDLEASNRRLADLISSMKTAVLVEDEHGAVVLANEAFTELFRLPVSAEELVGHTLDSFGFTPGRIVADPPDVLAWLAEMRVAGERVETMRAVLVDGRTIEFDFVPTRPQGTGRGHLWSIRDISRQARAEAERERLLASEREENRRLAEMDAHRSESIAAVSHELRTPLTSIVGYTQLLRNMIDGDRHPEELECIDAISRNVDRLLRLAGDVVALDTLESRTLPLVTGPVDVGDVLRHAAATVAPEAGAKAIAIDVDVAGNRLLQADGDRLVQLFENLLSNAVKFTPTGGHISVTGRPVRDEWLVEVKDTGIGIPDDEIQLLFGRYFRASNARTRGIPGSGLGLSVARAIVQRHGGSIAVESVVGVGTTVTVRLGDAPEHEGTPAAGSTGV